MNQDGILPLNTSTENRFQYNGKELEKDGGIDLSDYGARWYDGSVGRFTGVDPLVEKYSFQSPYAYAVNSPIRFIDFMGLGAQDIIDIEKGTGEITVTKAEGDDVVRLIDNGKEEDSYVYGNNGSFKAENTIIRGDFGGVNGTSIVSTKTSKLESFYRFAAKSDVEFAKYDGTISGSDVSVLFTSGNKAKVEGAGALAFEFSSIGFEVSIASHSHPGLDEIPSGHYGYEKGNPNSLGVIPPGYQGSGGDVNNIHNMKSFSAFKNAIFQVYNAQKKTIATYDGVYPATIKKEN